MDNVAVSVLLKSALLQSTVCEHACACLCCTAEEEKLINCGCDLTWSVMLADLEKRELFHVNAMHIFYVDISDS